MTCCSNLLRVLVVWILVAAPARAASEDLQKTYPPTLTFSQSGLFPVCEPADVWELKSFEFRFGQDLEVKCKGATVAFGRHETNVLWAAVFPDKPSVIKSSGVGDAERAETIFLRFAPAELNLVFPPATVSKRGDAWRRAEALRIAKHKIAWKWATSAGSSTIVQPGWCLVDMDTVEGARRLFGVDRNTGGIEYAAEFEGRPVPDSPPITQADAHAVFDKIWGQFDAEYAGFVLLPELDWDRLGKEHRKRLERAKTVFDVAAVLSEMLAHLLDLHVWVRVGDDLLPGYVRPRPINGNWEATRKFAHATEQNGKNLYWGRTEDGIGYLGIHGLTETSMSDALDTALEQLKDTKALVVDLRFNGGGDELLGRALAGRFVDEERTYSLHQFRNGPKHAQLGERHERKVAPRGPWRYEQPVILLVGPWTLSSAESLALMFTQCPQVTSMGDRTGGSSGNPLQIKLGCGITVNQPRWLNMDSNGNPTEHVGIQPDVHIEAAPDRFSAQRDPVIEAAFAKLCGDK